MVGCLSTVWSVSGKLGWHGGSAVPGDRKGAIALIPRDPGRDPRIVKS